MKLSALITIVLYGLATAQASSTSAGGLRGQIKLKFEQMDANNDKIITMKEFEASLMTIIDTEHAHANTNAAPTPPATGGTSDSESECVRNAAGCTQKLEATAKEQGVNQYVV